MWGMPQWVTAILVILPLIILVIIFYKVYDLLELALAKTRRVDDRNLTLATLRFIPYVVVFYYVVRFSMHIFSFGAWGWTGEEFVATSVRGSMLSMNELLLLEGVPVFLVVLFGTTGMRIAYKRVVIRR